jgi:hypothetical protein
MWIQYNNGSEYLFEVKYSKDLNLTSKNYERTIRQINIQQEFCKMKNMSHCLRTEKEIRGDGILLSNMKQLLPYTKSRLLPIETDRKKVLDLIKKLGNRSNIGTIHSTIKDITSVRIREAIFLLIYQGMICENLDKIPFSNYTEVWINDCKENN